MTRGSGPIRPAEPAARADGYLWTHERGPQRHLPDKVVMSFAQRVITHQLVAYAEMVASTTVEVFYPGRAQGAREACITY